MHVQVFLCLLAALVSCVVGPKKLRQESYDKESVDIVIDDRTNQFLKTLAQDVIKCSLEKWITLLAICKYNEYHKIENHQQTCTFMLCDVCDIGGIMTMVCDGLKTKEDIVQRLIAIPTAGTDHRRLPKPPPASICFPAYLQLQDERLKCEQNGRFTFVQMDVEISENMLHENEIIFKQIKEIDDQIMENEKVYKDNPMPARKKVFQHPKNTEEGTSSSSLQNRNDIVARTVNREVGGLGRKRF